MSKRVKTEEELDDSIIDLLEKTEKVQESIEKLNDEASEEVLKIEQAFNEKRRPLYAERTKFLNHPMLGSVITDRDQEALDFLVEIDVQDFEDIKKLKKVFKYDQEGALEVTGTSIKWKSGKDLTQAAGGADKDSKRGREEAESFFTWFDPEDHETEIAELIKEEIWPNPLKFFQEAEEDVEDGDEGEEFDDEDDEGEEDQ